MPYSRTLQAFTTPGFYAEAPASWEARLREISPITGNLDFLRFRYMEPHESWHHAERGQWVLYSCKPIAMVTKERAQQFEKHWSELLEFEQPGRQAVVSNYQHFLWHSQGLYAKPFLILQGEWGGTPAQYTPSERAFLEASDCFTEPFPLGFFPACAFDERAVKQIAMRDRMLKVSNSYSALEYLDTPQAMKNEDEAAAKLRRQTFLDTWAVINGPSVEFMKSYLKKSEAAMALPDAPVGLADTVSRWKEEYVETGHQLSVAPASQRKLQVAVP